MIEAWPEHMPFYVLALRNYQSNDRSVCSICIKEGIGPAETSSLTKENWGAAYFCVTLGTSDMSRYTATDGYIPFVVP